MSDSLFNEFDKNCIALLDAIPNTHSRACFRSALHHLGNAKLLESVDPAMAIFRGITAEEEAASGLMHCLREGCYVGSRGLQPRNHVHKHAMIPFLRVIGLFHGQIFEHNVKEYRLHIKEEEGQRRLMFAFPLHVNGEKRWAYPIPPLNFGVKVGTTKTPPSYESQITSFVDAMGAKDILSYLKKEANLRNEVLYASPNGYPVINEMKPEFLQEKASHFITLLHAYLLIKPWKEPQPYVQDSLGAFLTMVGVIEAGPSRTSEG